MEPPVATDEAQRLDALQRLCVLDTPPEPDFDDLAVLAAAACRTPMALVCLVDADRVWFKAKVGLALGEVSRASSFWAHADGSRELFVVPDAKADARFADFELVAGEHHVRFYAGAPLVSASGAVLGALCVMDTAPRQLAGSEADALRALARLAASRLELRRAVDRRRALLQITNAIVTSLKLDDLLGALCQALQKIVPFDRAALTLHHPDRDAFRIFAYEAHIPSAAFRVGTEIPREDSSVGWVFDHQAPLLRRDLEREMQFPVERRLCAEGIRSYLVVPLTVSGKRLGTLNIGSRSRGLYGEAAAEILQEASNQVALAVANAQAYEEIASLQARLHAENLYLQEEISADHNFEEIVGRSPALLEVLRKVERVAPTDSTVLLFGETGTGKELFARAIHGRSRRRDRPLVKVNCGAISPGLVESELFGHVKGAFTGAVQNRTGRFQIADRGTLFLDEVSELPLETQVKLLRVLQEQEFEPVGSGRSVRVDVRVIAASNRRLDEAVRAGKFRDDLLYRLNVFPLQVPPLRERPGDIPLLVALFLGRQAQRLGKGFEGVTRESMERLLRYPWPGNVRELQNVIDRAAILSSGTHVTVAPDVLAGLRPTEQEPDGHTLEVVERAHIVRTLRSTGWVVEGPLGAATILGLHPNTLRSRMKKLGITRPAEGADPRHGLS